MARQSKRAKEISSRTLLPRPSKANPENRKFVLMRRKVIQALQKALRKGNVDLPIISIAKKFARLRFGYVDISCGGHFYREIEGAREANSLTDREFNAIGSRQKLYYNGAHFEVKLNNSPTSLKFRAAVEKLKEEFPSLLIEGKSELTIWLKLPSAHTSMTKQQALNYQEKNSVFLKSFEQLVDSYVKKYGTKARL